MANRPLLLLLILFCCTASYAQDHLPPPPNLSQIKKYEDRIDRWKSYCRQILDSAYTPGSKVNLRDFVAASKQGIKLAKPTDTFNRAHFMYFVGAGFQNSSKYDSAIVYLKVAVELFRKIKAVKEEVPAIRYLHYSYYFTGQGEKRDPYMAYLRQLLPKVKDKEIKVNILGVLSEYAFDHSDYETAINYKLQTIVLEKELKAAKGKSYVDNIAVSYMQIAETYQTMGNAEKTIYYLDAAKPYVENNANTLNTMYLNYMSSYVMLDKEREALQYFKILQKHIKGREGAGGPLSVAYRCMADYYIRKQKFKLAEVNAAKALQYAFEVNSPQHISDSKITLGSVYFNQQNYPEVIKYLATEVNNTYKYGRERFANTNYMLAESYAALNDHKTAYRYFQTYSKLQDSLYQESSKKSIAEMDGKYHREASLQQIKLLDAENAAKNIALKEEKRTRWILVGAVAVVLFVSVLIYRNYKNKQRANLLLDRKNHELDTMNEQLSAANDTKSKLFSIISHDLRSPVSQLFTFLKLQKENPELLSAHDRQQHQDKLISASERLLDTLEDLLMWSKSQMDHFDPDPEHLVVTSVFEEITHMMHAQAEARNLVLEIGAVDCKTVFADHNLLLVILRNLVQNAINHAYVSTTITLSCACVNNQTRLMVTNKGNQIPADKIAELLNTVRVKSRSSGYGLMIVRELLVKAGGVLSIESTAEGTVMMCVF